MAFPSIVPASIAAAILSNFKKVYGEPVEGTEAVLLIRTFGKIEGDPLSFGHSVAMPHYVYIGTENCCPACPTCMSPIKEPTMSLVPTPTKEWLP